MQRLKSELDKLKTKKSETRNYRREFETSINPILRSFQSNKVSYAIITSLYNMEKRWNPAKVGYTKKIE